MSWTRDDLAPADRLLWDAMGDATPRFSSMPTPGAHHELPAFDVFARKLGDRPIPWQRWAVRVLSEKYVPDPVRYTRPDATLTVERQSGKTTITRALLFTRGALHPRRRALYTAQTGKDATARWQDLVSKIEGSSLRAGVHVRQAIGSQVLTIKSTGSTLSPFAPTQDAVHGDTPHDVAVDECFKFDEAQGNALQGAIKPAQQTLPDRQAVWLSTAGDATSTFLRAKVDRGRLSVADLSSRMGYLEWSLAPDLDPYDEANWIVHPGYQGGLVGLDDLREFAESVPEGEWRRAFWNQWVEASSPLYDVEAWRSLPPAPEAAPALKDCVLGFALDADRTSAAIVAAWTVKRDGVSVSCVRTVWQSADVEDLPRRVLALHEGRPRLLVADEGGLTRGALDTVRRRATDEGWDAQVRGLTSSEWVVASTSLVDRIKDRTIAHYAEPVIEQAVRRARPRKLGEAWALSHASPAPILAMVAALRGLDTVRTVAAPAIYLPSDDLDL